MKAQIKMIIASVIVIALALTAVSGITYSWFSDTEEAEIDISTAVVDLEPTYALTTGGSTVTSAIGTTLTLGTSTGGVQSFTLDQLAANQQFTIISDINNNSTVKTVYRMYAIWEKTDGASITNYDIQNISINGNYLTTTEGTSDSPSAIITNWTVLEVGTDPTPTNITIATPTTYGDKDTTGYVLPDGTSYTAGDWNAQTAHSGLIINIVIEAYQGDYPYQPMTLSEDKKTATANLPANKVVYAKEIKSSETSAADTDVVKDIIVDFSNVSTVDTLSTAIASQEVKMIVSSVADSQVTLNLSMTEVTSPVFDKPAVITMTVPGAISTPKVVYNGTAEDATVLSSTINGSGEDATTTIVFSVTHFSEYVIKEDKGVVETKYELQKALAAGGNVKLGADITITMEDSEDTRLYVGNGSMQTLDLNEKTLTIKSASDNPDNNFAAFYVNGNFTIKGNGTLVTAEADSSGNATKCMFGFTVLTGGHLTIKDGTYVCGGTAVQVQGLDSTVVINGGTFNTIPFDQTTYKYNFTLNYIDSIWGDADRIGYIQVFGGSFLEYDPANSPSENPKANFCADGYASYSETKNGKTVWIVVPAAAKIGDVYYATLEGAFEAAQTGSPVTIDVLRDSNGNGIKVKTESNITVNFNGYTYLMDGKSVGSAGTKTQAFQLLKDSTVVFKNGTLKTSKSPSYKMVIQNYSNLTLNGMTVDGSNIVAGYYTFSNNNGTISIVDSTIIAPTNGVAFDVYGAFDAYTGPNVTVSGDSKINGVIEVDKSNGTGTVQTLIIEDGVTYQKVNVKNVLSTASVKIASGAYDSEKVTAPSGYEFTLSDGYYVLNKTA